MHCTSPLVTNILLMTTWQFYFSVSVCFDLEQKLTLLSLQKILSDNHFGQRSKSGLPIMAQLGSSSQYCLTEEKTMPSTQYGSKHTYTEFPCFIDKQRTSFLLCKTLSHYCCHTEKGSENYHFILKSRECCSRYSSLLCR